MLLGRVIRIRNAWPSSLTWLWIWVSPLLFVISWMAYGHGGKSSWFWTSHIVEVEGFICVFSVDGFCLHSILRGASPLRSFWVEDLSFRFLVTTQLWEMILLRGLLIISLLLELLQNLFLRNMALLVLKVYPLDWQYLGWFKT